ncbi:MAG TPA: secondary thiamine-phosphate synthase enzyme YjbQ [Candidatus Brocadiia bacterium]|nr:secondary thiamine-phosphate synthase enzyme YjbQ [Candidatus Brocadiia bacterium]
MKEITVRTANRAEFLNVTDEVRRAVATSSVRNGICVVSVPHTTAGVTINENADPDVPADMIAALERIVPRNAGYAHAEGNSDAHLKASIMGSSQTIPVVDGKLVLGVWQGVFFCEFDGPRTRKMNIQIVG